MRAAGEEAEAGRRAQAEDRGAESETSPGALGTTSRLWLAAMAALSTLPMIHRGSIARIEFDGWWHVFIARQDVWSHLWEEIDHDAHPPLYYLLLKAVCQLGSSPLVYRSLSIVAAAAATFALGATVARTSQLRVIPVLAALAFGFATSTVIVAVEVRSYMLAAMFLLFALTPYLRLVEPGGTVRSRFLFVTWITASFLSHYGILFIYAAMLAAPAALCLLRADYRQAWRLALPWRWRADLATVAPPALVMAAAYAWHMDSYRGPMRHLPDFYYSRGESLLSYVGRNLVREVDLFSPLALSPHGPVVRGLGVLIAAAIPLLLLWLVRRQPARAAWRFCRSPSSSWSGSSSRARSPESTPSAAPCGTSSSYFHSRLPRCSS